MKYEDKLNVEEKSTEEEEKTKQAEKLETQKNDATKQKIMSSVSDVNIPKNDNEIILEKNDTRPQRKKEINENENQSPPVDISQTDKSKVEDKRTGSTNTLDRQGPAKYLVALIKKRDRLSDGVILKTHSGESGCNIQLGSAEEIKKLLASSSTDYLYDKENKILYSPDGKQVSITDPTKLPDGLKSGTDKKLHLDEAEFKKYITDNGEHELQGGHELQDDIAKLLKRPACSPPVVIWNKKTNTYDAVVLGEDGAWRVEKNLDPKLLNDIQSRFPQSGEPSEKRLNSDEIILIADKLQLEGKHFPEMITFTPDLDWKPDPFYFLNPLKNPFRLTEQSPLDTWLKYGKSLPPSVQKRRQFVDPITGETKNVYEHFNKNPLQKVPKEPVDPVKKTALMEKGLKIEVNNKKEQRIKIVPTGGAIGGDIKEDDEEHRKKLTQRVTISLKS
jgi:hypothetical protein